MGDEADDQIKRRIGEHFNRVGARLKKGTDPWNTLRRKPLEGELKMAHLTGGPLPLPPKVMPEDMKQRIAALPENQRAVHILAFNEDISLMTALQKYNQYKDNQRRAEKHLEEQRWYNERYERIQSAQTVEDLKGLLTEILEHIWGPK